MLDALRAVIDWVLFSWPKFDGSLFELNPVHSMHLKRQWKWQ
jgi:hypothetical protein